MNATDGLFPDTIDNNAAAEPSDDDIRLNSKLFQTGHTNERNNRTHSIAKVGEAENTTTNKTAKQSPQEKHPRQRSRQNELSSSKVLREKYTTAYRNRAYGTGKRIPPKRTSHSESRESSQKEFSLSVSQVRRARLPRSVSKCDAELTPSRNMPTLRGHRKTRMDDSSKERESSTQHRRRRRKSPRSISPRRSRSSSLAPSVPQRHERCSRTSKQHSTRNLGRSSRRSSHQQAPKSRTKPMHGSPPKLVSQSGSRRITKERTPRRLNVSSRRRISRSHSFGALSTEEATEESQTDFQSRPKNRRNALDIQRSQVKRGLDLQDEHNGSLSDSDDDKDDRILRLMARLGQKKTDDKRHHSWPSKSNPVQEDEGGETSWTHFSSAVPKHLVTTAASATNHVANRAVAGAQASANTAAFVAKATATSATYVAKATAVSAAHVLTGAAAVLGVQQNQHASL